jgi:hypothetical protein
MRMDEIQFTTSCAGCGYNLKGLDRWGKCPECGRAIVETVEDTRLEWEDKAWVGQLRIGTLLLIAGLIGFSVLVVVL